MDSYVIVFLRNFEANGKWGKETTLASCLHGGNIRIIGHQLIGSQNHCFVLYVMYAYLHSLTCGAASKAFQYIDGAYFVKENQPLDSAGQTSAGFSLIPYSPLFCKKKGAALEQLLSG